MDGLGHRRVGLPAALSAVAGGGLVLAALGWEQPSLFGVVLRAGMAVVGGTLLAVAGVRSVTARLTPLRACVVPLAVLGVVLGLLAVHALGDPKPLSAMFGGWEFYAPGVAVTATFPLGVALARRRWVRVGGIAAATGLFLAASGAVWVLGKPAWVGALATVGTPCGAGGYLLADR